MRFIRVCSPGPNLSPKRNGLWAILAIRVCTDPHFKNRPEIVDHLGTFGILFSTYYALGHTYCNLTYYLGWIVWTLGCRVTFVSNIEHGRHLNLDYIARLTYQNVQLSHETRKQKAKMTGVKLNNSSHIACSTYRKHIPAILHKGRAVRAQET